MATPNRRRPRPPKAKSRDTGPDARASRVRHLLDAQFRLEDALETAEEDDIIATLETSTGKGSLEITKAMDDYLQRSFSNKNQSFAVTDERKAALRELRKSATKERLVPSDLKKERLGRATESLVITSKAVDGNGNEALGWEPKRYKVLDSKDPRKTAYVCIYIDC
jgi:hypothetical protein